MIKINTLALFLILVTNVKAQRVVYDAKHFGVINENGAVQNAAEATHNQYLEKIDGNIQSINTNAGSVILAQSLIYDGLRNVNSALKNGIAVRNMAVIISGILKNTSRMMEMAKGEPYLLFFAENISRHMEFRSTKLLNDVSGFILKEGDNVLADYNSRDQLLRRVTQDLQILSSLAYGAWRAMYWAKQRGIVRSVNPYAHFINQDRSIVEDIIRKAKYLNQ